MLHAVKKSDDRVEDLFVSPVKSFDRLAKADGIQPTIVSAFASIGIVRTKST